MKNKKTIEKQIKTTITLGYSLFTIYIIAVLISIITFGKILFEPEINRLNVIIMLLFITSHMVIPTLVSYFIGDKVTHAKNKLLHHYNGILFGLSAFWLSSFSQNLSYITPTIANDANTPFIIGRIVSAWPILLTVAIMTVIAIWYNKNQKNNKTMLQYFPFQVVLFGSIIGYLLFIVINGSLTTNADLVSNLVPIGLMIISTTISYFVIKKTDNSIPTQITQSILAVTIGLISMLTTATLISYSSLDSSMSWSISFFTGLMTWIIYLVIMHRK